MSRDLRLDTTYPHPPDLVWQAIATRDALAAWLMPNDFEPRVGHRFTFRTDPAPGFDGVVHCEVITCDPPRTLSYHWRGGPIDTVVTYTLEPVPGGTRLHFVQSGFSGLKAQLVRLMLGSGWKKMARTTLPATLDRLAGHDDAPTPDADCRGWGVGRLLAPIIGRLPGRSRSDRSSSP
ncbi:MAG: SRPBCC domain-containing protein [Phycisphaerales bacterium]|nr:SRPBCC domain-containing protein [Phycisphaerales bacterium]